MADEFTISNTPPWRQRVLPKQEPPPQPATRVNQKPSGHEVSESIVVLYAPADWPSLHDRLCSRLVERPSSPSTTVSVWVRTGNDDPHSVWRAIQLVRERGDDLQVVAPDRIWGTSALWLLAADTLVAGPWLAVGGLDSPLRIPGTTTWHTTAQAAADETSRDLSGSQSPVEAATEKGGAEDLSIQQQQLTHREKRLEETVSRQVLQLQGRSELKLIHQYARMLSSDDDAGRNLVDYLLSDATLHGPELTGRIAEAKIEVVGFEKYARWSVAMRLLSAMWRSQEPIVWLVSAREAEQMRAP